MGLVPLAGSNAHDDWPFGDNRQPIWRQSTCAIDLARLLYPVDGVKPHRDGYGAVRNQNLLQWGLSPWLGRMRMTIGHFPQNSVDGVKPHRDGYGEVRNQNP